jgi:hypothetical protein
MLRLFQAGSIAALMQCIAILLLTPPVLFYAQYRIQDQQSFYADPTSLTVASLLQFIYLVTAVGLALTRNRFVDLTAARIRAASHRMHPLEPARAANTLLICLWFTAFGLVALTLGPPPSFLVELGWRFGPFRAAPIIWSAMMSVGVAALGANAQAAKQAE